MSKDRITVIEPYGNVTSNRVVPHGMSGEGAYEFLKIHHPNSNRQAERTQDPALMERNSRGVPRAGRVVDGTMEEVSFVGDQDGIPLVKKDLILTTEGGSRDMMVPSPVGGYAQFTGDGSNTINIWSGPPSDGNRELVGRVLHGARNSSSYGNGDYVPYGTPLVQQSNVGTKSVHAHVELEPGQYRRYLGDILNDRITLSRRPVQGEPNPAGGRSAEPVADGKLKPGERGDVLREPVLKLHSHGTETCGLQTTLHSLGYPGADGQPLKVDSDFGSNTDHAVRAFQRAHGLEPVDGEVGPNTRAMLVQAAQRSLVSETTHPNHDLYQAIARQLPEGTESKAIANIVLQARENGIIGPDQLKGVAVRGSDVHLQGSWPGVRVSVDLTAPTPDLQAMSDHMREQAQQRVQEQMRQQQQVQQPQTVMV